MGAVTLHPKLPKHANGTGRLHDDTVTAEGTWKPDAPMERVAVVRLRGVDVGSHVDTGPHSAWQIVAIEVPPIGSGWEETVTDVLDSLYDDRRLHGQMALDDAPQPDEMAELLAALAELADDLGVVRQVLADDFAAYYEHPVEGATVLELGEFLARKRLELQPAEDVAEPAGVTS